MPLSPCLCWHGFVDWLMLFIRISIKHWTVPSARTLTMGVIKCDWCVCGCVAERWAHINRIYGMADDIRVPNRYGQTDPARHQQHRAWMAYGSGHIKFATKWNWKFSRWTLETERAMMRWRWRITWNRISSSNHRNGPFISIFNIFAVFWWRRHWRWYDMVMGGGGHIIYISSSVVTIITILSCRKNCVCNGNVGVANGSCSVANANELTHNMETFLIPCGLVKISNEHKHIFHFTQHNQQQQQWTADLCNAIDETQKLFIISIVGHAIIYPWFCCFRRGTE